MLIEKTQRINLLYDFYQELLTDKQKEIIEYYYIENYSLTEISEILNISRNAVFDSLKKSEKILEKYEEKLHLLEKNEKRNKLYDQLLLNGVKIIDVVEKLKEIEKE